MSEINYEMLAKAAAMQAQPSAPKGVVSMEGINKYWPQLIGAVALCWFLVGQGKEQQALMGRVQTIEKSVETIGQVKADQIKTNSDVLELKIAVNTITTGQKELTARIDSMSADLRAVGTTVTAIAQSMRSIQK
jgi:hypothetical protein